MDQLYAVAFLSGVFNVIFGGAYQAFSSLLIGRDRLVDGDAKIGASSAAVVPT
ncbi:MAG TPA: hypothetical protein VFA78_00495 [Chloroflexota bacterium]|nr:hypothetical protein [Chloroflexota bacterium]